MKEESTKSYEAAKDFFSEITNGENCKVKAGTVIKLYFISTISKDPTKEDDDEKTIDNVNVSFEIEHVEKAITLTFNQQEKVTLPKTSSTETEVFYVDAALEEYGRGQDILYIFGSCMLHENEPIAYKILIPKYTVKKID